MTNRGWLASMTDKELVDRVGQRTVSRLIEMTTPYKITAKDYRMRMA